MSGYRRKQGKGDPEEGTEAGNREVRRVHMLGDKGKGKDWSCLALFSLLEWEKLSKTESVSLLAVESKEVIS